MARITKIDHEITVGKLKIEPFDKTTVWITDVTGEGGNFPTKEVQKALRTKQPAKALRQYYEENFP